MDLLGKAPRESGPQVGGRALLWRVALFLAALLLLAVTLALAPRGEAYVYWTHPASSTNGTPAGIGRANLDGTDVGQDFITVANGTCGVAVDGAHIYWFAGGSIARANLDGTGVDQDFIPSPS